MATPEQGEGKGRLIKVHVTQSAGGEAEGHGGIKTRLKHAGIQVLVILATFVLMILFLLCVKWLHLIPRSGGTVKVNPVPDAGIEITYNTPGGRPETVSVISVPAYRMATPTSIAVE